MGYSSQSSRLEKERNPLRVAYPYVTRNQGMLVGSTNLQVESQGSIASIDSQVLEHYPNCEQNIKKDFREAKADR